jgi:hypothetical protein|tara:strand:- start:1319 stop:1762 length:444 start_codon:yes stop_codon:yes gene_type:complete
MKHDEIINCPKSGGDLCYKTEINKDITNYYSLSCGFWTNTLMLEDSEFYEEQISILPEIYKDLAWTDPKTKLIWLPNTVNVKEKGMIFASGMSVENWNWGAVKAIKIPKKDQEKYKGEKYRADMSTIEYFKERDFIDALSYIGLLPE